MKSVQNKKWFPLVLAISSSLLLWLGWPPFKLPFLLFVGFIPLFYLDHHLSNETKGPRKIFWYTFLSLLLFNILTTWWVWNASPGGAIFMVLFDTFLMSIPFWAYRKSKNIMGTRKALIAFLFYWIVIEYLHSHWQFSFPWLSLGHGFSATPAWVQWFEVTGVSGGTLWILGLNTLIFYTILQTTIVRLASIVLGIVAPLVLSFWIGSRAVEAYDKKQIVVLQPNIDPYEKFGSADYMSQARAFLEMIKDSVDSETDLVVFPETALVEHLDEDRFKQNQVINLLSDFCAEHPGLKLLTGASTHRFYKDGEERSPTVRKTASGYEYESYNTALLIGPNGVEQKYHKSKLVPGVEKMPYPKVLGILDKLSIDLGGISGSLASDPAPVVFGTDSFQYAPLICYESVFYDYANRFVSGGSNLMMVITNDGWWKNTAGYRQHKDYARLRAIENRREVIRSANTGISCRIDVYGNVHEATSWWVPAVIRTEAKLYRQSTFFSRNGDGIGRVASVIAILTLLSVLVKRFTLKKNMP